jgi:hypothetical protein
VAQEIRRRDFDALIAPATIVLMRLMFLACRCHLKTDHRTFGDRFYVCCEELRYISFVEA